jgi:hypothetical protein
LVISVISPLSKSPRSFRSPQVFYEVKSWIYHNGTAVGKPETFNFTDFVLSKNLTDPSNAGKAQMGADVLWLELQRKAGSGWCDLNF